MIINDNFFYGLIKQNRIELDKIESKTFFLHAKKNVTLKNVSQVIFFTGYNIKKE